MSGFPIAMSGTASQLGLAMEEVRITPQFVHKDIKCDDFSEVPAELMWLLGEVDIRFSLIHYDNTVLDICIKESMAGGGNPYFPSFRAPPANPILLVNEGYLAPAGTMMGNGYPVFSSGNHFISLNVYSPVLGEPYNFPASYLTGPPVELPLGTGTTVAVCHWRCIPYKPILKDTTTLSPTLIFTGVINNVGSDFIRSINPALPITGLAVGQAIAGPGIPTGTTIDGLSPVNNFVYLSKPATAAGNGAFTVTVRAGGTSAGYVEPLSSGLPLWFRVTDR